MTSPTTVGMANTQPPVLYSQTIFGVLCAGCSVIVSKAKANAMTIMFGVRALIRTILYTLKIPPQRKVRIEALTPHYRRRFLYNPKRNVRIKALTPLAAATCWCAASESAMSRK